MRPLLLLLAMMTFSSWVISASPLVLLPFVMLAVALPRKRSAALALAAVGVLWIFYGPAVRSDLWYVERGWSLLLGGWFVAVTMRWPTASFVGRGLGALAGAAGISATWFLIRPGAWGVANGLVAQRAGEASEAAREMFRAMMAQRENAGEFADYLERFAEVQTHLFPGLLLLASLAALGVAWWLYVSLAQGSDRGLGPLRDFRFSDQLVWLAILGIGLALWGVTDGWVRTGSNTVMFMAALYSLRGLAVVMFLTGGVSALGVLLMVAGVLLVPWALVVLAVLVGVGDTWLDLREKARALAGS